MRPPFRRAALGLVVAPLLACGDAVPVDPGSRAAALPPGRYEVVGLPLVDQYDVGTTVAQLAVAPDGSYRTAEIIGCRLTCAEPEFASFTDGLRYTARHDTLTLPFVLGMWSIDAKPLWGVVRRDTLVVGRLDAARTVLGRLVRVSDQWERAATASFRLRRTKLPIRVARDTSLDVRGLVRAEFDVNGAMWPVGDFGVSAPAGLRVAGTTVATTGVEGAFDVRLAARTPATVTITVTRDLNASAWRLSFACFGVPYRRTPADPILTADSLVVDTAAVSRTTYTMRYDGQWEEMSIAYAGTARAFRAAVIDTIAYAGSTPLWGRQLPNEINLWGTYHPLPGAAADHPTLVATSPRRYEGGMYCSSGTGYRPGTLREVVP